MTTLQIALAGVGVLFVILVVGYNLWQERRYRREASRMFSSRREDILLGESFKTEQGAPDGQSDVWGEPDSGAQALAHESAGADRQEPVMDLGAFRPGPHQPSPQPIQREPMADAVPASGELPRTSPQTPPPSPQATPPSAPPAKAPTPRQGPTEPRPASPEPVPAASRFEAESPLDQEIEYVARLRFTKPVFVSYNTLMDKLRKLGKAVRGMGRRADGGWDSLSGHPPTAYEALEFGILLADRGGALTADQLEKFCRALYDFAAEEGGAVSCPDKHGALEKANALDMFCVDVDVLLGLNVVARDARPFSGTEIDRVVSQAGLRLGMDGAYSLADKDGVPQFSVANQEENPFRPGGEGVVTHGISLILDLPRVRDGLGVFDRMTTLGRQLADGLGGRLVDDNGRLVTQDSLQKDRKRLNDYFDRMQARGIPAGGERALRLFA